MKKAQSAWMVSYAETEKRIRQDERLKVLSRMFALNKRIEKQAKSLLLDILKLSAKPDAEVAQAQSPQGPIGAGLRLANAVPPAHEAAVRAILNNIEPANTPLTPTQIAKTWAREYGGRRMASLACEALVAKGLVEKVGRKGFRAVNQVAEKEDGDGNLDSTDAAGR